MNFIWSPWRMEYIQSDTKPQTCVFCDELQASDGPDNLIIHRTRRIFVILNKYPYTSGHLMVLPIEHLGNLEDLNTETRTELLDITSMAVQVLTREYHPEGFNLGINLGVAAGAGITGHLHMHIVPRWGGDTNFMSAISATRVLPESLNETYRRIKKSWNHQADS